jgi:hypothetical protein
MPSDPIYFTLHDFSTSDLLDVVRKLESLPIVDVDPLLQIASELRDRHLFLTEHYVLRLAASATASAGFSMFFPPEGLK